MRIRYNKYVRAFENAVRAHENIGASDSEDHFSINAEYELQKLIITQYIKLLERENKDLRLELLTTTISIITKGNKK